MYGTLEARNIAGEGGGTSHEDHRKHMLKRPFSKSGYRGRDGKMTSGQQRTRETRGTREHRNTGTQETRERRDTGVHETQEPTKVRDQGSPSGNAIKICFRVW